MGARKTIKAAHGAICPASETHHGRAAKDDSLMFVEFIVKSPISPDIAMPSDFVINCVSLLNVDPSLDRNRKGNFNLFEVFDLTFLFWMGSVGSD
mmetsp:Transcript_12179/g.16988  ORF Transcript_12179/g.16988 Transcript_12179/m.16988 type:complete len:95 (-) Transcript_12179:43-327(-)